MRSLLDQLEVEKICSCMLIEHESIKVPCGPAVGDAFLLMEWVPHAYNKQKTYFHCAQIPN